MFIKFVKWCLRRLLWDECSCHTNCFYCKYMTDEGACALLETIIRLN